MDLLVLIAVAFSLLIVIITAYLLKSRGKESKSPQQNQRATGVPLRAQEGIPRRAQIARNQRNRTVARATTNQTLDHAPAAASATSREDDDDSDTSLTTAERKEPNFDDKIGAKKRAKLEAKAEKKAQREAELHIREERKKKDALLEEERKLLDDKEREDERKREDAQRLAREEQERRDHEEYLKMKAAFSVEEEGFEEDENENDNVLKEFIDYIKNNKVVVLEDLANHFKLKTQQAIDRITDLQTNGSITGVIDDRGKFIYISETELEAVAKFIKQRGRVSITELAESSNKLINLTPIAS